MSSPNKKYRPFNSSKSVETLTLTAPPPDFPSLKRRVVSQRQRDDIQYNLRLFEGKLDKKARTETTLPKVNFVELTFNGRKFYMAENEFKPRFNGDLTTIEKDWERGQLAADVWNEGGEYLNPGDEGRPDSYILCCKSRPDSAQPSLQLQTEIWRDLAFFATGLGARNIPGMLWKPREGWTSPRLTVFVAPLLQHIDEAMFARAVEATISYGKKKFDVNANDWFTFEITTVEEAKAKDLVLIGQDLFSLYRTYVNLNGLGRLINEQTRHYNPESLVGWARRFPSEQEATKFESLAKTLPVKKITMTQLNPEGLKQKSSGTQEATKIMGRSAPTFGQAIWNESKRKDEDVATWLHRSASNFGASPDNPWTCENLVFGTGNSNTHMTRYEFMISNVLRDLDEAGIIISGLLKTEIDQDHSDITGKDGQYQEVLLPEWRNLNRFPWFSPTLNYGGELTIQRQDADFVLPPWNMNFHTFSCFCSILPEGVLDWYVWKEFYEKKVEPQLVTS